MRTWILMAMVAAGCNADPCSSESGLCINLRVEGNVEGLDQLAVSVDRPAVKRLVTPQTPAALTLPSQVALVFPAGTSGGATLSVDGLRAGVAIAHGQRDITFENGAHITLTLETGARPPDLAEPADLLGADLSGEPDMSMPGDLAGADLTTVDDMTASCTGLQCGTTCVTDSMTNAAHCGACNHSCLTGTCVGGVCQPFTLTTLGSVGSKMVTDDTDLYLRDSFNIYRCPLPSCAGGKVTVGTACAAGDNYRDIAINPAKTALYYVSSSSKGQVKRCTLPGCTGEVVFADNQAALGSNIAVDSNNVYWASATAMSQCAVTAAVPCPGTAVPISGNGLRDIVSDNAGTLYWSNTGGGTIGRCALPSCGGAVTISSGLSSPIKTALIGSKLYWLNFGASQVQNCTPGNCAATQLTILQTTDVTNPEGIAFEGATLFAGKGAVAGRMVGKCTLPDCSGGFTTAASGTDSPRGLLVTTKAIYWLAGSGAVMGVAR